MSKKKHSKQQKRGKKKKNGKAALAFPFL